MSANTINPFNITKAVDYSDEEIKKYWVDISQGNGFIDMVKPQSPMPMFILGGKGSGKTHIMRYFSFNLQKIRYGNALAERIASDRYIGIYLRCGGLNSSRFEGSNGSKEAWKNIFAYYLELWFSQLLTNVISDFQSINSELLKPFETSIINSLYKLFDVDVSAKFNSFNTFNQFLQLLQRQVDYEVNNVVITGEKVSDIRILVSPGKLIFGLPRLLEKIIPTFKSVQFIFLIDEFENLHSEQQRYINTLIREREAPVSFRIGVRWYGVKTYSTFSGNEDLKNGSEIEKYIIDNFLRKDNAEYEKYAREICMKRLTQAGFDVGENSTSQNLESFFEEFDLNIFLKKIKTKEESVGRSYLFKLEENLKRKSAINNVKEIIGNLKDDNRLIERTNVMLFYREWKEGQDLIHASEFIRNDALKYKENPSEKNTAQFKVLDKFKNDLIDQLHRESREPLSYSGIDKLIKMSAGIPRHFLIMLKYIYKWSIYNGENPFSHGKISELSQRKGLLDTAQWFLEDARASGDDGKLMSSSINRIGQYLQDIRFSNTPPECSLSSFSIKQIDISPSVGRILDYLEQYSYLVRVNPARDKNSNNQRLHYQIDGILSPIWELPIYRRGVLSLTTDEVNVIFNPCADSDYLKIKNHRLSSYNVPFKNGITPTLFED
jgi:hypothetical protein